MSAKIYDGQGRWRSKTVGFRISPEEDALLEKAVAVSGLTKQEYITNKLLNRDVVVVGSPRVYKNLRNQLAEVFAELQRIESGGEIENDLLEIIKLITITLQGLKEEN